MAEVSGKAINFKDKAGNFTADIVLVHATQADIRLDNATFDIAKRTKETLTFNPLSERYVVNGTFSAVEILANIQTAAKKGRLPGQRDQYFKPCGYSYHIIG